MNASTTAQGGLSNKVLGPDAISGEHSTILSDRSADADADAVSAETEVDRDRGGCGVASRDGGEASAADAAAAESSPSAKRFKLDDGSSAPAPLPLPDTAAAATATARNTPGGPSGGGGDDWGEELKRRRPSSSLEASSSTSISTSTSTSADVAAAAATVAEQSPEVRIISSTGAGGIPPTSPEVRILSLDGNYFSDGDEKEGGNGNGDDDDGDVGDDEVKVACCNVTNATVQYAHPRHQCGVRRFHTSGSPSALAGNAEVCPKCYCYVCDVPAGECSLWSVHCHAHSGDDRYVAERRRRKAEGKVVEIGSDGDAEATDLARAERMSVLRGMGVAVPASVAAATVDDAVQAYYRKMGSALEESGADVTLLPEDAGEGGGRVCRRGQATDEHEHPGYSDGQPRPGSLSRRCLRSCTHGRRPLPVRRRRPRGGGRRPPPPQPPSVLLRGGHQDRVAVPFHHDPPEEDGHTPDQGPQKFQTRRPGEPHRNGQVGRHTLLRPGLAPASLGRTRTRCAQQRRKAGPDRLLLPHALAGHADGSVPPKDAVPSGE